MRNNFYKILNYLKKKNNWIFFEANNFTCSLLLRFVIKKNMEIKISN
jgi:hypothetical protein